MDERTRTLIRYGLTGLFAVLGILLFFQTRDPMILIFAVIAAGILNLVLGVGAFRAGATQVRVKCRSCGALNLDDAKYCSQCGRSM